MITTYKIKFNAESIISKKEYLDIIKELSLWYHEKITEIESMYSELLINKDYKKSFHIMHKHKELVMELIRKLVNKFSLQDLQMGIYLSNSFARGTNLIDSDIDLNFMYEDFEKGKVFEELISNALATILWKYRDFVHDSISHRMSTDNEEITKENEVIYEIYLKNDVMKNKITKGNERLMYRLYHSHKDLNSFTKYYTEQLNCNNLGEWIYFQNEIYSSPNYLNKLFSYIHEVENNTAHLKFNNYKEYLVRTLNFEVQRVSTLDITDISQFKKYFKNTIYQYIYEVLILLKKGIIIEKKNSSFIDVKDLLSLMNNESTKDIIHKYFGSIMLFNYICRLYGIEFRTRYSNPISDDFKEFYQKKMGEDIDFVDKFKTLAKELLLSLIKELELVNTYGNNTDQYDPLTEQINIENYSPLSYINNVSKVYQHDAFLLPYVEINGKIIPMHPDTLDDLKILRNEIVRYELVYPTSSFRTVYSCDKNVCYKLPVLRQITRSIRDLSNKELMRSEIAQKELSKHSFSNFSYLDEKCICGEKEIYNYIIRKMPEKKVYPWFYCIASGNFPKSFMIKCIENMISIWMYYASLGIYFESAHTQNFLVDDDANVYYRDLSDIRILKYDIMIPSYIDELKNKSEMHSIFFDRSMCDQNIEHFIRYCKDITNEDIEYIKSVINREIEKYNIEFPDYSMNYDKSREGHHPIKTKLTRLRIK